MCKRYFLSHISENKLLNNTLSNIFMVVLQDYTNTEEYQVYFIVISGTRIAFTEERRAEKSLSIAYAI